MEDTSEYDRVLSNPDNVILSEELQEILSNSEEVAQKDESHSGAMMAKLIVSDEAYECSVKKIIRRSKNQFDFKLSVPAFPVENFMKGDEVTVSFHDMLFTADESPKVAFRNSGLLTFTARRILKNEEV